MEQTYVMLKPDAFERKLVGEVIARIEKKGFVITDCKMLNLNEQILKEHYAHLTAKPFFKEIVDYITRGPVLAMVVEGENAVQNIRNMAGVTNPLEAAPGTIRADFATSKTENIIHCSDSTESAKIEIKRFFNK